jgi:hypothetical protein
MTIISISKPYSPEKTWFLKKETLKKVEQCYRLWAASIL